MRVLLDECIPRTPRKEIRGHDVKTVAETGWAGVKNGELLRLAASQFDVLITVDRNLEYQQNLSEIELAVVVIHATSNDVAVAAISEARPGSITHIGE
jgi:uncharacterized protein DUF5615